ncbi:uncharacterized protein EHS24_005717 [Apiotrichum porosum]|uniref:Uncharacterized protein n=1 Tax=Apiotrichum porosum TaxID=105984 RepID=A0A427XZ97_9TREE|nr:uncharacterized protein EHS24_005717 [Apiotrichum porosum]RSH84208.1 hypothetical protein EHS24_005717 [Apiotrichum porosum]
MILTVLLQAVHQAVNDESWRPARLEVLTQVKVAAHCLTLRVKAAADDGVEVVSAGSRRAGVLDCHVVAGRVRLGLGGLAGLAGLARDRTDAAEVGVAVANRDALGVESGQVDDFREPRLSNGCFDGVNIARKLGCQRASVAHHTASIARRTVGVVTILREAEDGGTTLNALSLASRASDEEAACQ